jgi:hypothetical protein
MTDDMENQGQSGAQGSSIPGASQTGTQAPSAVTAETVAAIMERLDRIERGQQSTKDKRIAKLMQQQDGFNEKLTRLQELTKQGLSQDDALWRINVEDALAAKLSGEPEGSVGQGKQADNQAPAPKVEADVVLKAMGLDPNSAEVGAILRETDDFTAQMAKFAALAVQKKAAAAPTPSAAQQMPGTGGGSVQAESLETLNEQIAKLQADGVTKNWAKIKELSDKRLEMLPHE